MGRTSKTKAAKKGWVVTWTSTAVNSSTRGKLVPSELQHKKFDDDRSAVGFVMNDLDGRFRGNARLTFPDGTIVELPVIEQMYAAQTSDDE
jgi:hypothetical protein